MVQGSRWFKLVVPAPVARGALFVLAALCLAPVPGAHAGQVRVTVGYLGQSVLFPSAVTVSPGDHVVWVWGAAGHTVTSGTTGNATGDGTFRSASLFNPSLTGFAWKVAGSDSVPYYCFPHWGLAMKGVIRIAAPGTEPIADFRITEVEFAGAGGVDRVQITNLGTATGYLGRYRISFQNGVAFTYTADPVMVAVGGSIRVVINFGGSSNQTIFYTPTGTQLASAGSFALFVPNSTDYGAGSTHPGSLIDPDQLVDYVEWGTAGQAAQAYRGLAETAGLWPPGDVVDVSDLPAGGAGYSISFCGSSGERGTGYWAKTRPNFGTSPRCATPLLHSSWGRVKALYR